jgi:ssDNA-binding Zn-finger/Zn-ribbon topoisomerase 1
MPKKQDKKIGQSCPYCKEGELIIEPDSISVDDFTIKCNNPKCDRKWLTDIRDGIIDTGPYGIGGWKYAQRLNDVARKTLVEVTQQKSGKNTKQQIVHASKALLGESTKIKEKSVEVMEAYQEQLLTLAEHMVNEFLPWLSKKIKDIFKQAKDGTIERVETLFKKTGITELSYEKAIEFWKEEVDRAWRQVDLKKIELMFAESLTVNEQTKEAFQFTEDLLKDYIDEKKIIIFDNKSAEIIKQQGDYSAR